MTKSARTHFPFGDREEKVAKARKIFKLLKDACIHLNVTVEVDPVTLSEVVECYVKDIRRIHEHQGDEIAPGIWIGYLMFWVCKLKPIRKAVTPSGVHIQDANEQVEVRMGHGMFVSLARDNPDPSLMPFAKNKEIGELRSYLTTIYRNYVRNYYIYLAYSLRHRNLTGDALALWISGLFSSLNLLVPGSRKASQVL